MAFSMNMGAALFFLKIIKINKMFLLGVAPLLKGKK
jgi:hypothetical protein